MLAARHPIRPVQAALALLACGLGFSAPASAQEPCFERLDNGIDLTGWQKSTTNHHGPGDGWTVENGAFVGRQTAGQQGGILMTDASYSDVEVVFEVMIDWGCDSGFFFRTTDGDRAYQVNVDFLEAGGVGTIWGESFAQELYILPFSLTNMGDTAVAVPDETPLFDVSTWTTIWHKADFTEMRARVEGNPPRMQVWISDVQVLDFTDQQLRGEIDATGPLAIQVHGGTRWLEGGSVQYRNIRVKDLTLPCDEPDPGAGGTSGAGGGAGSANAGGAGGAASGGQPAGGFGGMPASGAASGGGQGNLGGSAGAPGGNGTVAPTTPASSSESGGCGCRTAPSGSRSGLLLAVVLGLLGVRVRRRSR